MMDINEIKRELKLTNKEIAEAFGYNNERSYSNSSGKKKIEAGIVFIYQKIDGGESISVKMKNIKKTESTGQNSKTTEIDEIEFRGDRNDVVKVIKNILT